MSNLLPLLPGFPSKTSCQSNYETYTLVVSGVMNPPQLGHILTALKAVEAMPICKSKFRILYAPNSEEYLADKYQRNNKPDEVATSVAVRCQMIEALIQTPTVQDFLMSLAYTHNKAVKLQASNVEAVYQAAVETDKRIAITTDKLIDYMIKNNFIKSGAAGFVFGLDNLIAMPEWDDPTPAFSDALRKNCVDLVILNRDNQLKDLKEKKVFDWILRKFNFNIHRELDDIVKRYMTTTMLSQVDKGVTDRPTVYLLPALPEMDGLSSSELKNAQKQLKKATENNNAEEREEAIEKIKKHGYRVAA
jgi:nicotinic acid mononucleotide adenylyltransferase